MLTQCLHSPEIRTFCIECFATKPYRHLNTDYSRQMHIFNGQNIPSC